MVQKIISFIIAGGIVVAIVLSLKEDAPVVPPVVQASEQQAVVVPNQQNPAPTATVSTKPVVKTIQTNTTTAASTGPKSFSFAEVAKHDNESSCWTVVNGNVYNVTSWISQHPGGAEAILQLCGTDGSEAFNDRHGGERRPEAELASFKIGVLK